MQTKLKFPIQKQAVDNAVHNWFDCSAIGDYEAAYYLTFHDPYYEWTPALMERIINGYGLLYENGETRYVVTDWRGANGNDKGGELDLYERQVKSGGYTQIGHAYYQMPLNGEWSDLSAVFRLVRNEDGAALLLVEIHIPGRCT